MAKHLRLSEKSTREFVAACLLHDIGHYPLSHSAEPGFIDALGASHHQVSEWIICGMGPITTARSLRPILERDGLDADRIWSVISGTQDAHSELPLSFLLIGVINLDTLEGIIRTAKSFGRRSIRIPSTPIFELDDSTLFLKPEALPVIDRFWQLKDRIYTRTINLPSNVAYEAQLSELVAKKVSKQVFAQLEAFDDPTFFRLLDIKPPRADYFQERDRVFHFVRHPPATPCLGRTRKRYWVDSSIKPTRKGLPHTQWKTRYRHMKEQVFLVPRADAEQLTLNAYPANIPEPEL